MSSPIFLWLFLIAISNPPNEFEDSPGKPDFQKEILPLLVERCSKCHSEEVRIVGLTVTTATGLKKGSQNGPVIIPKQAEDSLLYKRLKQEQMPPGGEGKPFNQQELDLIRRWINAGAKSRQESGEK